MTFRQLIDEAHKQAVGQSGMSAPYLLEVIRALANELDRRDECAMQATIHMHDEPVLTITGELPKPKFTRQQKLAIADEIYDMPKEYNESGIV